MTVWKLAWDGGVHDFGAVSVARVDFGSPSHRTDDESVPRGDGVWMGQDFQAPGDVVLDVSVSVCGPDPDALRENVRTIAAGFTSAWNDSALRDRPGVLAELWCGEIGIVEGRPRGASWDWENYAVGYLTGTARFVRDSDRMYDPAAAAWQSARVGIVSPDSGGLVAPLVAPLSTARPSTRAQDFIVSGESTWPIIEVRGPLQDGGRIELVGQWVAFLNRGFAAGDEVVIDTRPGRRSMTLNGAPVNVLSPSGARMDQMVLPPGSRSVALRGTSVTGTAEVTVLWREMKAGF